MAVLQPDRYARSYDDLLRAGPPLFHNVTITARTIPPFVSPAGYAVIADAMLLSRAIVAA